MKKQTKSEMEKLLVNTTRELAGAQRELAKIKSATNWSTLKTKAVFKIHTWYRGFNGNTRATIIVEINYVANRFVLKDESGGDLFRFWNSEFDESWKAVANCIDKAVDFARKELNPNEND